MNENMLQIMDRHCLLHESNRPEIINDRKVCESLLLVKSIDEWNTLIGSLSDISLRADIESFGIIKTILGNY